MHFLYSSCTIATSPKLSTLGIHCAITCIAVLVLCFPLSLECIAARKAITFSGLKKSGRVVAFCDWKARFCDQKIWCSRNYAPKTRRPGASLRPLRWTFFATRFWKQNLETAFDRPLGHAKESDMSLASCLWLQLGIDWKLSWAWASLMSSSCSSWPPLLLVDLLPGPSVDRQSPATCSRTSRRLCFFRWTKLLSRAWLETTRIVSGKVWVTWKNTWVWATMIPPKRKFGSSRRCRQPWATVAWREELSSSTREVDEALKEMSIPC